MADDILNLDSSPILREFPNYADDITGKMTQFRTVLSYPGTVQELISFSSLTPREYSLNFRFMEKKEEFDFIQFFKLVDGRVKKFWYLSEEIAFNLLIGVTTIDDRIIVRRNNFANIRRGDERIVFRMRDGDIITRLINDLIDNDVDDEYTLIFTAVFDRDIEPSDIFGIFFILPVRFDQEAVEVAYNSSEFGETDVRIKELLKEYP